MKKKSAAEFCFTHFEEFRYLMKHAFVCLIYLLKLITECGESEGIKSPKSMQIYTGYLNLFRGSDSLPKYGQKTLDVRRST